MRDGEDEKKEETFKVSDKRRFNPDGTEREDVPTGPPEEVPPATPPEPAAPEVPLPEVGFADFILSLAASAQMNLGLSVNPFSGKVEKHLPQAKQTIDLLGVLAEKTKGNLSTEEDRLLQVVLADLRLRYLEGKNR